MIVSDVTGINKLEYNISKEDKRIYMELLVNRNDVQIYNIARKECDNMYLRILYDRDIYTGKWKISTIKNYGDKYIVGLLSMDYIIIVTVREWR